MRNCADIPQRELCVRTQMSELVGADVKWPLTVRVMSDCDHVEIEQVTVCWGPVTGLDCAMLAADMSVLWTVLLLQSLPRCHPSPKPNCSISTRRDEENLLLSAHSLVKTANGRLDIKHTLLNHRVSQNPPKSHYLVIAWATVKSRLWGIWSF